MGEVVSIKEQRALTLPWGNEIDSLVIPPTKWIVEDFLPRGSIRYSYMDDTPVSLTDMSVCVSLGVIVTIWLRYWLLAIRLTLCY